MDYVSTPCTGFSHFHGCPRPDKEISDLCQRPARAFLIFTVPSQPPYKQRLPSLIFASIYLTILITSLFHRFFGMFIVYSYFPGFILNVPLSSFFLFFPFLCNVLSISFYILSVFLIVLLERIMIMEYSCP